MLHLRHVIWVISFLLSGLSVSAFAYQVQPMVAELHTSGNRSAVTYRVINPSDTPVPIEVVVYKRSFDENQKEILTETEEDFIVLPPQVDVPANGYQVFRAQFLGDPDFEKTQSYRIVFKQLPIEQQGQASQVNMIFNFATLVFVSQPDTVGQLLQTLDCTDKEHCYLNIVNTGDAVVNLVQSTIHINGEMTGNWQWLQQNMPVTFLMPEHKLSINIKELIAESPLPAQVNLVTADNAQ
ncbi:fimbria/pilus periplasmic chaperone [Planctobacterium marinum]|uniref:fimbria/pilus periplasmic chaperone n=1 Tax=Planctobacterium marinum TaxID=1631968 RepID=UPI001E44C2EF|nr:fimbria/pilus periplasmic chaperone [Planctobacterium marinum]MCC2607275.1 fimbria/pilus periplasmic chaperone [Planctobacterium marinum]